jgi:hypothetical protein
LREIAVFGGTAHPALAAEIHADLLTRQEPLGRGIPAFWPGDTLHQPAPRQAGTTQTGDTGVLAG